MKIVIALSLAAYVLAASSCDNPLFSVANWPTGLVRPRYLTSPAAVSNSTFCTKFQSGATQTCCDKDTIGDIVANFHSNRNKMKQKGEGLEGGVRDTFNDFDPDNQASGGRLLRNLAEKNKTEPPAKGERPPGFDSADVPEGNLTSAERPKGRGKEKKRPGLLKLSAAGKESIKTITRTMNALMKQFAHSMGKCMKAQLNHLAGMMCMGCDPDWSAWVTTSGSVLTVAIADDACTVLTDACLDFVKQAQNLPTLIEEMKASIQAVIDSEIAAGTITQSEVPTEDLSSQTRTSAQITPLCSTDDACKTYICEVMTKGKGVAADPEVVADPASVDSAGRLLASTVTFQYTSSGYNSIDVGTAATGSSTDTSTFSIDGVSAETSPLDTSTGAVYLVAGLLALVL